MKQRIALGVCATAPNERLCAINLTPIVVIADSYAGMGDAQATLAGAGSGAARASQWREASCSYQKSLDIWVALRDARKLASDQVDRIAELEARMAEEATAAAERPWPQ